MKWWIFLILVIVIVMVGSLAYGCSELTIYSWPVSVGVCQRHWVVWQFLYDYQGLVGGLLALMAAGIGASALRNEGENSYIREKKAVLTRFHVIISICNDYFYHNQPAPEEQMNTWLDATNHLALVNRELMWVSNIVYLEANKLLRNKMTRDPIEWDRLSHSLVLLCTIADEASLALEEKGDFILVERQFDGTALINEEATYNRIPDETWEGVFKFFRWS